MQDVATESGSPARTWIALAGFLGLSFLAALPGALVPPGAWYQALSKPSWNPPAWVFGPVWTLLYVSIGVSAWLVWRRRGWGRELGAWSAQMALNALWTPLFFGLHALGGALIEIVALWLAILGTVLLFWRARPLAGALLLPYLAWVGFAAVLNATLWRLNAG